MVYGFSYSFKQNIEILHPNINVFDSGTDKFVKKRLCCVPLQGVSVYLTTVHVTCCKRKRVYILRRFCSAHTY